MPVYVDYARNKYGRMIMCHMIADSLEELHAMARAVGMRKEWFQDDGFPHYDLSLTRRKLAVAHGALEVGRRKLHAVMKKYKETEAWRITLESRRSGVDTSSSPISTQSVSSGRENTIPPRSMLIKPPKHTTRIRESK